MAKEKAIQGRLPGAAAAFIETRVAVGRLAFPMADLIRETGLSATAAKFQLLRLGGQVVRVTRQHAFFLIVTPEHRLQGAPPVGWWLEDYFRWLGRPYYLALQSAAAIHGSAPQAIQETQVMTDRPRREVNIGRTRIRFFVKRGLARTPTETPAQAYAPLRVSTPEATVFDLVRYASRLGGWGRAVETILPLLEKVSIPELKKVLQAENEVSTAQRLGFVMEQAGQGRLAEVIRTWLPDRPPLIPLVPTKDGDIGGHLHERWQLLDNSGEAGQ